MTDNTFGFLGMGLAGYILIIFGAGVAVYLICMVFLSSKPQKPKKMENNIMDTYVPKKEEVEEDVFKELDEISKENIDDIPGEPVINEPITYAEIYGNLNGIDPSEVIANSRKTEDKSYSIIKRRMEAEKNKE